MHPRIHSHTTGTQDKNEDYKEFGDDEHINGALLLKGMQDLYAVMLEGGGINTTDFDIKYTAGIADDSLTYYRDRNLPDTITVRMVEKCQCCNGTGLIDAVDACAGCDGEGSYAGAKVDLEYDFLFFIHELFEQSCAEGVGRVKKIMCNRIYARTRDIKYLIGDVVRIHYRVAHQVAEALEFAIIDALGIDRQSYDDACKALIDQSEAQTLLLSPGNLDLYPYEDEKDIDALRQIVDSGGPESELLREVGQAPGDSGKPYNHGD